MNRGADRLAVITEIISPYRIPVFNKIGDDLRDGFLVLFMAETEEKRQWRVPVEKIRFNYEVLPGKQLRRRGEVDVTYSWNPSVISRLRAFGPDVIIIGGYHHPTSYAVWLYAKLARKKLVLWCESTKADCRSGGRTREAIKRLYIWSCDKYLVPGTASAEYLQTYGVDENSIILAPNTIYIDAFAFPGKHKMEPGREGLNEEYLGTPAGFTLLFVGRLAQEKGFPVVIDVLERLQNAGHDVGLWVVGDGPMRKEYENLVRWKGLRKVVFAGFRQPEQLAEYYGRANAVIMPSISEPWGLVVNEAMTCGVPVLCSMQVGAGRDMVVEGETGYRCESVDCYVLRVMQLIQEAGRRKSMEQKCKEMASRYSPEACATGFLTALKSFL